MRILVILLAFGIASCVLRRTEHGHTQDDASEAEQVDVPVGCADQLEFVREERIEREHIGAYGAYRHYLYKSQPECNTSVIISHDAEFVSNPIDFMDAKNISCGTDGDGNLLLNFPHYKHEKYSQVKFPCDTKQIVITKIPSWDDFNRYIEESRLRNRLNKKDKENKDDKDDKENKDDKWRETWLRWRPMMLEWHLVLLLDPLRISLAYGVKSVLRSVLERSEYFKIFRKKVLGGLIIVYASHQQTNLRNPSIISSEELGTEGQPYEVMGVSKEGSVVYHILVDKNGRKQMIYPQQILYP